MSALGPRRGIDETPGHTEAFLAVCLNCRTVIAARSKEQAHGMQPPPGGLCPVCRSLPASRIVPLYYEPPPSGLAHLPGRFLIKQIPAARPARPAASHTEEAPS